MPVDAEPSDDGDEPRGEPTAPIGHVGAKAAAVALTQPLEHAGVGVHRCVTVVRQRAHDVEQQSRVDGDELAPRRVGARRFPRVEQSRQLAREIGLRVIGHAGPAKGGGTSAKIYVRAEPATMATEGALASVRQPGSPRSQRHCASSTALFIAGARRRSSATWSHASPRNGAIDVATSSIRVALVRSPRPRYARGS